MDCLHARVLLLFARPSETAPEDADSLHDHLDQCTECRGLAEKDKRLDGVFTRAMRKVPVAADLEDRILQRLSRERRPRPWTWVATAAALLLGVSLGAGWFLQPRPEFPIHALASLQQPDASPERVTAWFREQGLDAAMPTGLDPQYLDSWEVASLQNHRVPKLLFVNRGAVAHVYVVPTKEFHFDQANLQQALVQNSLSGDVLQDPHNPDFFFVEIYSGGSRDSFARPGA